MIRKDQILNFLKQRLPSLKQNFKVKSIAIFGFYAREEQTEKSDIDLLVEFEALVGFFKFIKLDEHLSEKLGAKVEIKCKL